MPKDTASSAEKFLEITAPARLHFGLLSFGNKSVRQHGGAGVMIDEPALKLSISASVEQMVSAPDPFLIGRVKEIVARIQERIAMMIKSSSTYSSVSSSSIPQFHLRIEQSPLSHVGLGSGTQLALSIAAAITKVYSIFPSSLEDLVRIAGRAERSSIGSYGFAQGGLIVESGKFAGDTLGPIIAQIDLPGEWRVVLIIPNSQPGLSGDEERAAFMNLPPVHHEITYRLTNELMMNLIPAAKTSDFENFSESLYRYGELAGSCFASVQGSSYANDQVARIVASLRDQGVRGVGQSSWGPLVFAWFKNQCAADEFVQRFADSHHGKECDLRITKPTNHGALLSGKPIFD
jgi:beta-ribofuranosylaminobenzene 5'-phosphate synthase